MDAQSIGIKVLSASDHDFPGVALDLQHVEWGTRGQAQALALTHGEVVDAAVLANRATVSRDQFSGSVGKRLALLSQVGVDKILVVAARDKANLLRIGLLGRSQAVLAGQLADFRLGHVSQREQCPAKL